MADFVLIVRGEPAQRTRTADAWSEAVTWRADLSRGRMAGGDWLLAWSAGAGAPVDRWRGQDDTAAIVVGDAYDGDLGRLDAERAAPRFLDHEDPSELALDGYHVTAAIGPGGRVVVSGDLLGLYPLYWGHPGDGSLVVSSSPAAFTASQAWAPEIDTFGLAGLLSIHGTVGGRTILSGVRRVPAGHALIGGPDGCRALPVFSWPEEESLSGTDEAEQDERLHHAVGRALRIQLADDDPVGLMLTGGRDSRMLAGHLKDQGRALSARTIGRADDFEARLASRVARHLGVRHDVRPLPAEAFVRGVRTHVRLDHLASGAAHAYWWGAGTALDDLPRRTVTGHLFDIVVGGVLRYSGRQAHGMDLPWERAFPLERRAGIDPALLATLRAPDRDDALEWVHETLRASYHEHPTHQRVWRWMLGHYGRFHIGCLLRPISFATWPVVPVLDRRLLELAASLDSRGQANRRGQDRTLLRYYPQLSRIPHVFENAEPTTALRPTSLQRWAHGIRSRFHKPASARRRRDQRFVWRNTDFSNPGWLEVRRLTEPLRPRLHDLFDPKSLDAYLPGPHTSPATIDFSAHQGPKLLIGLAHWLDHVGL